MYELGLILTQFREQFGLSRAKAAKLFGISDLALRSLEEGLDARTGKPFRPRESTLRMLADKMSMQHGFTIGYEDLRSASVRSSNNKDRIAPPRVDDIASGETEANAPETRRNSEVVGAPNNEAYPWTAAESALIQYSKDNSLFLHLLNEKHIRNTHPDERRWVFDLLRQVLEASWQPVTFTAHVRRAIRRAVFGRYPATDEEMEMLENAERLQIWLNELDDPSLYDHTPEERKEVFSKLGDKLDRLSY
jgi:transcriptional regulator with XRE-family HTH domain